MKSVQTLAFILMFGLAAVFAHAASTKTPGEFVKSAAIANKFEIETSKLALQRTKNQSVREFAQMMVNDHNKAGKDLEAIVPKSSVAKMTPPKMLDAAHQAQYEKLAKDSDEDFDRNYIAAQVNAHNEAVALFSDYSSNGDDEVIKDFATKTLPTLQNHQRHVAALDNSYNNNGGSQ